MRCTLKGIVIGSVCSMIVLLAANALAGTGVGGIFNLGQANTVTTNTSLVAPVAGGKALQLTNNDTSNAASTALGLTVASGHAPFTVNTGIKVANLNADKLDGIDSSGFLSKTGTAADSAKLGGQAPGYYLPKTGKAANADKLDGIDSTGFVQGAGKADGADVVITPTATAQVVPVLNVPGFGSFDATCSSGLLELDFTNTSGMTLDVTRQDMTRFNSGDSFSVRGLVLAAGDAISIGISDFGDHPAGASTFQMSGSSGDTPVLTVNASVMFDSGNCVSRVSYTETG